MAIAMHLFEARLKSGVVLTFAVEPDGSALILTGGSLIDGGRWPPDRVEDAVDAFYRIVRAEGVAGTTRRQLRRESSV